MYSLHGRCLCRLHQHGASTNCMSKMWLLPGTQYLPFAPFGGLWISSINLETAPHIASRANIITMLLPRCPWQVLEYVAAMGFWAQVVLKSCCRHDSKRCLELVSGSALVCDVRDAANVPSMIGINTEVLMTEMLSFADVH
jgi:hypothetical protein